MLFPRLVAFVVTLFMAPLASAQDSVVTPYDGSFEDALFGLETAIIDRGLKVDHISHVGDMLNRTGADLGTTTPLFERADIYLFCSATLSREMMEADLMNVVHCPYGITLAQTDEGLFFAHRVYPDGPMKKVEAYLSEIVEEAASF